jgi:hypothetical protein
MRRNIGRDVDEMKIVEENRNENNPAADAEEAREKSRDASREKQQRER